MMPKEATVVGFTVILFTGCATMFDGTKQSISVNSNVSGAEVLYEGTPIGVTPLTVQVPKKKGAQLLVRKSGHTSVALTMTTSTTNAFIWGDVVVGGILFGILPGGISTTVDASNDSMYEYSPNNFFASLEPQAAMREEREHLRTQGEAIRFCLTQYPEISRDMARGEGEYRDALCEILGAGDHCWMNMETLTALWKDNPEPASFALAVAGAI